MTKTQVRPLLAAGIYATIRASENVTIRQLTAQTDGASAAEVQNAINMLLDFGLIHHSTSRQDAVWADELPDSFEQAFENLLLRLSTEVELLREIVRQERRSALRSTPADVQEPNHAFTLISGRDARLRQLTVLYSAAQHSLDSLVSEIPTADTLRTALADEQPLYQSSLKIRSIYPENAHTSRDALEYINAARKFGADFRSSITAPVRLVIIDKEVAMLSQSTNDPDADALIIREPTVVRVLVDYYETLWRYGRPFLGNESRHKELEPIDQSILEGLLAGKSKKVIAEAIGRDEKTVRRRLKDLRDIVGVTTGDFALGVAAKRNGWVK